MIVDPLEFGDVPPPVARYLHRALRDRHLTIAHAEFRQSGALRTGANGRWMAFTARHNVVPARTEFVWEARVQILPFVRLDIRDSYIGGRGAGDVKLFSKFTLDHQEGGEPVNAGSLHRYLAEAVWYPTALLPSDALQWSAIDETKSLATLTHGETTVSLEFWFNSSGAVAAIYTPGRWGAFPDGYKEVPWEGRFHDYGLQGGLLVPSWAEVGWHIDGAWSCVWTGRVESARYDFSPQPTGEQITKR